MGSVTGSAMSSVIVLITTIALTFILIIIYLKANDWKMDVDARCQLQITGLILTLASSLMYVFL